MNEDASREILVADIVMPSDRELVEPKSRLRSADEEVKASATEDTEYKPEEGLSKRAWRNVKVALVISGMIGNLLMRFGLVAEV